VPVLARESQYVIVYPTSFDRVDSTNSRPLNVSWIPLLILSIQPECPGNFWTAVHYRESTIILALLFRLLYRSGGAKPGCSGRGDVYQEFQTTAETD
jgi:hypothetical protein